MKNIFKKIFFSVLVTYLFISCSDFSNSDSSFVTNEKGRIIISTNLDSQSRSVLPTGITEQTQGLTWELVGTCEEKTYSKEWNDRTSEDGVITTAYNKMKSDNDLLLDVGTWLFSLKVKNNNGYVLVGTTQVAINSGENTLSFVMNEATSDDLSDGETVASGSIEFTLKFPKDVVDNVEAKLFKYENNDTEISNQTLFIEYSSTDNCSFVKYSYPDATGTTSSPLSAGYYILKIELQQDTSVQATATDYQPINTYSCLIRVAPGLLSQGKYTLPDLAQLYTITYKLNEGTFDSTTSAVPTSYNAYTSFELPTPTRNGYEFAGWYTQELNEDNIITEKLFGNAGETETISEDITLYAKWKISWDGLKNQIENDSGISEFVITEDLTATSTITVSKPFKITSDKNVTITRGNTTGNTSFTDAFFRVESVGNLELAGTEEKVITLDGGNVSSTNDGGAVHVSGGTFTMNDGVTITKCNAKDGGAVYITNVGTFNMTGGTITGCSATLSGGGVWMDDSSSFTMSGDSKIEDCNSSSEGGGVYVTDVNNPCTFEMLDNATITRCRAVNGGGGVSYGCGTSGTFEISENAEISKNINNNNNSYGGGGIFLYGELTMNGGTISGNEAYNGAGVYVRNSSSFTMNVGTISDNKATGYGGGVYLSDSTSSFTMNGGVIGKEIEEGSEGAKQSWEDAATEDKHSNSANGGGGGIYAVDGTVTIKDAKVSYNYVPDDDKNGDPNGTSLSSGGGICMNKGTLILENTEVSYNRGYLGGGVRCYNDGTVNVGTLTLKNATIKGNAGKHYGWSNFGGALAIRHFDVICDKSAEASIIEENYSADGGAVFLEHTRSTLENITIQNNSYHTDGYRYGSEMLLWENANISIASNTVNISSDNTTERKGIFINRSTDKLNLSGNISLNSPINLHFESGQSSPSTVTVAGNLSENNVATIYLVGNYTEETQVLVAEGEVNLADQVGKFTLKNENYKISDDGTVVSKSGGGGTVNPDVTVTSWSTLKSTIESIDTTYTEENPYVIEITSDITTSADTAAEITVSSHVKLVSNTNCIITRTSDFAGVNLFQVNTEASLTIGDANAGGTLTLDGGGTDVSATKSLVNVTGTLVLNEKSVLQNNNCPDSYATSGAAVFSNGGTLKVFGSTIKNNSNNHSSNFGGAIYIKNGTLNITSGTFEENKTNKNGGAIYVTEGTVNITGGNFINNKVSTGSNKTETSYGGGAIYIDSAETSISAATFESNITEDGVGTLLITNIGTETSPAMIYNCTFTNNTAYQKGAAIYTGGTSYIEINDCTFTGNTLSIDGSHDVYIGNTGGTTKINGSAMTGAWTSSSN